MLYNQSDLNKEIRELHDKIIEKRKAFNEGMKKDMVFEELRNIYVELKELDKRLELCFQESNAQQED
jgi:hypothetical protein